MTRFNVSFAIDGDIFVPDVRPEIIRLLGTVSTAVASRSGSSGPVRDLNGNTIGEWSFEIEEGDYDGDMIDRVKSALSGDTGARRSAFLGFHAEEPAAASERAGWVSVAPEASELTEEAVGGLYERLSRTESASGPASAAEIRRVDLVLGGVEMALVHADVWDAPDDDDERVAVYYEDEERPPGAVPLYRLQPR